MKVLFFVDTHGSPGCMRRLREKSVDADLIVCGGDFTIFEDEMSSILREFNGFGKPVLIIHGNHETSSSVRLGCEHLENLHFIHKHYYVADDLVFYGFGGGGFSVRDESFARESELFIKEFRNISEKNHRHYRLVLITHAPPYGNKLDNIDGHVGNRSIFEFIHKYSPMLAISGHIHETAGMVDMVNGTKLINPGCDGMIIDL